MLLSAWLAGVWFSKRPSRTKQQRDSDRPGLTRTPGSAAARMTSWTDRHTLGRSICTGREHHWSFLARAGFTDDVHVGLQADDRGQAEAHDRMVVDDNDANHGRLGHRGIQCASGPDRPPGDRVPQG
jgi:hypothetical protein